MKILFVHPGPLLYTNVFLRLEPLGLELVAEAARRAKHTVRLLDLQVESHADYHRMLAEWQPDFIAFSCNYLANVPEIVDLAKAAKCALPRAFIGVLEPCASIDFSRGCPWDCSFCSAWTFYGRSYRLLSPECVIEDLASIREPGLFIVDDVAFVQQRHGLAIGEAIARKGIRKNFYLETRGDVLLRHKEVFQFWKKIGLTYIFLGLEALDEEGLRKFRKRIPLGRNFEALEFARSLGVEVAINLIADPDWDEERFRVVREWCMNVPEVVNISINTPYPGTETWLTEQRRLQTRD